jgi:hypothetical protein
LAPLRPRPQQWKMDATVEISKGKYRLESMMVVQ